MPQQSAKFTSTLLNVFVPQEPRVMVKWDVLMFKLNVEKIQIVLHSLLVLEMNVSTHAKQLNRAELTLNAKY